LITNITKIDNAKMTETQIAAILIILIF